MDSSGFSSSRWVSTGKQDLFESNRAQNLAAVARLDITSINNLLVGTSLYYGGTTDNRQKNDLENSAKGEVLIADVHFRHWTSSFRTQGSLIWGRLNDADIISNRNSRISNSSGFERSAVSDQALGFWSEIGYNISPYIGLASKHRLDPFFRFDYYDTHFKTRKDLLDNARYERFVYTTGISHTYNNFLVSKLDYSIRSFGEDEISKQNTIQLALGFIY